MKLTEEIIEKPIEIVAEQQQKKEIRFIGQQRKISGLTLWEFNESTGVIQPAKFKKQDFKINSLSIKLEALQISHKVEVNEGCFYLQALNKENALKKLNKLGYKNIKP